MTIQLIIPGQPQGKGRPRVGKVAGNARLFTPAKTVAYEGLVAHEARVALAGAALLEGPLVVDMILWCQPPKSLTKAQRAGIADGSHRPTTKPDIDNVVKAIFDGCNAVLWRDDVQVVELTVSKHYTADAPRVVMIVEAMVPAPVQQPLIGEPA